MTTFRIKVWTGPTLAIPLARMARRAKLKVPIVGTEHIYIDAKGSTCAAAKHNASVQLYRKYKTDWNIPGGRDTCTRRKR